MINNIVKIAASVLLTLHLLMPVTASAQAKFGVRGGLNVSNVSFETLPDRSERFGYHLGVFADLPILPDFISVQPELSYSTKGAAYKLLNDRQTLNLNYVDFLLPVAFHLGSIDIQVGPFASIRTSKKEYTVYNDIRVIADAFKPYDVGLTAGLSFNTEHFLLGIRFNQGFVDVTKDDARLILGDGKNAVGQLSLGFKF